MQRCNILLLASVGALILASPAQAYLDPATGSMVVQAVLAGIAAVALVLKTYWTRIKSLFSHGQRPVVDESEES